MVLKYIESLAKKKHALLLVAGMMACMSLGSSVASASTSDLQNKYHSPSAEQARVTDLGDALSYHSFKSSDLDSLLVRGFKMNFDNDIATHYGHRFSMSNSFKTPSPNTSFRLSDGEVEAYSDKYDNDTFPVLRLGVKNHYSDISDGGSIGVDSDDPIMTYYVTKHNLVLRQLFSQDKTSNSKFLKLVKYHLVRVIDSKISKNGKELVFIPTELQYNHSRIRAISKHIRNSYPLVIYTNSYNTRYNRRPLLPKD